MALDVSQMPLGVPQVKLDVSQVALKASWVSLVTVKWNVSLFVIIASVNYNYVKFCVLYYALKDHKKLFNFFASTSTIFFAFEKN